MEKNINAISEEAFGNSLVGTGREAQKKPLRCLLDTSFILSCVREKIDFFEEIKFMGLKVVIPIQVLDELKSVVDSKKKLHFREEAKMALELINRHSFEKIDIKEKYVDKGLMKFAKENPEIIVATLDREIKKGVKNHKLILRAKKKLEIV